MRIIQVSYRRNRPNPDNQYVHSHVECTVSVAVGESPKTALKMAQSFVNEQLGLNPSTRPYEGARVIRGGANRSYQDWNCDERDIW